VNCSSTISPPSRTNRRFSAISHVRSGKKIEKSLRETASRLKTLKTAKFRDFYAQRYQVFSKVQYFAGEAISFRFRFV